MRTCKKYLSFGLIIVLIFSLCSCSVKNITINPDNHMTANNGFSFSVMSAEANYELTLSDEDKLALAEYEEKAQNKFLALFINPKTAAIATVDKRSGKIWYSNSPTIDEDSLAQEDTKNILKSQIMVEYMEYQATKTINSYAASILNEKFKITSSNNGVQVEYSFMDTSTGQKENGGEDEKVAQPTEMFNITLEYTLDNESLIANIPLSKIKYKEKNPPLKITLLQNFGSCLSDKESYIFVPDGSGALIRLEQKPGASVQYMGKVYGFDKTFETKTRPEKSEKVCIPVFGMKTQNQGYVAIIEDGDAIASVCANKAGVLSDRNEVFTTFDLFATQKVSIGVDTESKFVSIQKKMYQGNIKVRYAFLEKDKADYIAMAKYYRQYLIASGNLIKPEIVSEKISLNLEIIGAIDKLQSFLGINYDGVAALTTFNQAQEILKVLKDNKIDNINLKYDGWFNGGIDQEYANKISVINKLGGEKDFKELCNFAKENKIGFYPNVKMFTAAPNSKGFNRLNSTAKQLDQKEGKLYRYNIVNLGEDGYRYIIKPSLLSDLFKTFGQKLTKIGDSYLCIDEIGSELFSDYTTNNVVDRQTSQNYVKQLLKLQQEKYGSLMITGANAYAMQYADVVMNAPSGSSNYFSTDESVPFLSFVYHGYKSYSSVALNDSYISRKDLLKAIEYGENPSYKVFYQDSNITVNTKYDYLCANSFMLCKDDIIKNYAYMDALLSKVCNSQMIDHKKISDNVYQTSYENGVKIAVNYNDEQITVDGVKIEPLSAVAMQ